jgi:hypothetical protein
MSGWGMVGQSDSQVSQAGDASQMRSVLSRKWSASLVSDSRGVLAKKPNNPGIS